MQKSYNSGKEEKRKPGGLGLGGYFSIGCGRSRGEKETSDEIGWRQRTREWMFLKNSCFRHFNVIQVVQEVKNPSANAGGMGSVPESGRSPGEGNGNPLQYSCLENPMDRGVWRATVHGVTKSQTQLST